MQEIKRSKFATSHADLAWRVMTQSRRSRIFWIIWFTLLIATGVVIAIADIALMVRAFTS